MQALCTTPTTKRSQKAPQPVSPVCVRPCHCTDVRGACSEPLPPRTARGGRGAVARVSRSAHRVGDMSPALTRATDRRSGRSVCRSRTLAEHRSRRPAIGGTTESRDRCHPPRRMGGDRCHLPPPAPPPSQIQFTNYGMSGPETAPESFTMCRKSISSHLPDASLTIITGTPLLIQIITTGLSLSFSITILFVYTVADRTNSG